MPHYTVVVLYPDAEWNNDYPQNIFVAFVEADDVKTAEWAGVHQARNHQPPKFRSKIKDWIPLVIFEGYIEPLKYAWQSPRWK